MKITNAEEIWSAMCLAYGPRERGGNAALPHPFIVALPLMSPLAQAVLQATFDGTLDDPVRQWLHHNAAAGWSIDGFEIAFADRSDALLFRIRFNSADCRLTMSESS